jgi:hypothetical protein
MVKLINLLFGPAPLESSTTSAFDGFCPKARNKSPNASLGIVSLPSLSKSLKAL